MMRLHMSLMSWDTPLLARAATTSLPPSMYLKVCIAKLVHHSMPLEVSPQCLKNKRTAPGQRHSIGGFGQECYLQDAVLNSWHVVACQEQIFNMIHGLMHMCHPVHAALVMIL